MKKLLLVAAIGISALLAAPAKAQVSVNVNIGSQPEWGPSGYDHVDYYYLPEIQSYYYVPTRRFIYYSGNHWVHSEYVPDRYRSYDLRRGRKIVINSDRPYLRDREYRSRYSDGYNRPERRVVYREEGRDRDYRREDKHDNGRHEGWGKNGKNEGGGGHGKHGRD
jgi:hypothetical protein